MTAETKVVNYTPEQTAKAVADYQAGVTVEAIAEAIGKTARSVIAKLSKEGVYVAKGKTAGKRDMLKSEMVAEIAKFVGKTEEQVESLEKATGPALMAILTVLKAQAEQLGALSDDRLTGDE
ncbi:MAG: hypothetical protein BWY21_00012 [Parcubacteria group bacterium ADurb.Bin216]|nr:MAG: hypothetical protein BWY21_00012 [Parcubacteria group bacterium ADurb.Bin216]